MRTLVSSCLTQHFVPGVRLNPDATPAYGPNQRWLTDTAAYPSSINTNKRSQSPTRAKIKSRSLIIQSLFQPLNPIHRARLRSSQTSSLTTSSIGWRAYANREIAMALHAAYLSAACIQTQPNAERRHTIPVLSHILT